MATKTLLRIETITTQIEKLNQERAHLTETLNGEITNLLKQKNALSFDFETLVGGLLSIIDVLKKEDETTLNQKQTWKKDGKNYLGSNKKNKAPITSKAA
jgi:hypothetical protein